VLPGGSVAVWPSVVEMMLWARTLLAANPIATART
jgi:hypothetical protein